MTMGDALIGSLLSDRYRVEACLAYGGMSVVYRGADERLGRPVSIKVFCAAERESAGYRAAWDCFVGEAAALARLRHPHTLRIYDFGLLPDGLPFQVAELVEGGTLRDLVRREGALAPRAATALLAPVLDALAEVHDSGLVHRDVKPSNLLVVEAGGARLLKLADFGIAAARTRSGAGPDVRLYSPGWSAPEQIRGEAVTPAADVFSAGLVVAYAVGGRRPLERRALGDAAHGGDVDGVVQRAIETLGLPPRLRDVVFRACRADPGRRYADMSMLRAALREACGDA